MHSGLGLVCTQTETAGKLLPVSGGWSPCQKQVSTVSKDLKCWNTRTHSIKDLIRCKCAHACTHIQTCVQMHTHACTHIHACTVEFKCLPHSGSSHHLCFPELAFFVPFNCKNTLGTAVMWLKKKTAPPCPASVTIMHHVCLYILFGKYKNQIEGNKRLRQTASGQSQEGLKTEGSLFNVTRFFHLLRERRPAS